MDAKSLRRAIEQLLESQPDNKRLRDHLEGLSRDPLFPGLTSFWGPRLYARNKAIFRPFILNHFSDWMTTPNGGWSRVLWKDHIKDLEPWLQAVRTSRDVTLVRRLQRWKFATEKGWGLDEPRWNAALVEAYKAAPTPAARAIVLDEFDDWFQLDEATAMRLYDTDRASAAYIQKHLPAAYWSDEKRIMWDRLGSFARAHEDTAFYFTLYRKLMPVKRWREEVLALASSVSDPAQLNRALEERHLEGYRLGHSDTIIQILEQRGRDVVPYIRAKLEDLVGGWGREKEADRILALAERNGWWDVWSATARTGPQSTFQKAVAAVVNDKAMPKETQRERLKALAGVSQEWNWPGVGLARVHTIDDNLACLVYERFADLIRGPFRQHVTPHWWGEGYPRLVERAQAAGDEDLMDTLAARYATHVSWERLHGREPKKTTMEKTASVLAASYQAIRDKDAEAFARRASNVLTRIPAYASFDQNQVLRTNDLARLLFARSLDSYLAVPAAVQDLIEGSNIHVMKLAYRVLALPDPRAEKLAAENIDILMGTLLRPLHRKTRLAAFDALSNAARGSAEAAARVHARARDALKLPDKKYPKAELIGLIGRILSIRPELAAAPERAVVHRRPDVNGGQAA
jgi:hypothetical protein